MIKAFSILTLLLSPLTAMAIPMDWHGVFGADTTVIDNYRRISRVDDGTGSSGAGSEEVPLTNSNKSTARFQSYIFRLMPSLIVNDTATIKAELTTDYQRGGDFGENQQRSQNGSMANALYYYNSNSGKNLTIKQAYAEIYADTATYLIGRHTFDWGMGAVYNSGKNTFDRHVNTRDGITMQIKLGHFLVSPYYAKIAQGDSLTRTTRVAETGIGLLYDNVDRDLAFGLHYSQKKASIDANESHNTTGSALNLNQTDTELLDLYFKQRLGRFTLEAEIPLFSGELGNVYNAGNAKYKSQAILGRGSYDLNDAWKFSVWAGTVSGDDGGQVSYEAMYLNPNFQIAKLLFRYNLRAISNYSNSGDNLYDSYVTNTKFLKLHTSYQTEKWLWEFALVWAKANEVAKAGSPFYDHETNTRVALANTNQSDDLGMELDTGFTYQWNSAVKIGAVVAYLKTGEYYAFTNSTTTTNSADDSFLLQANTSIEF